MSRKGLSIIWSLENTGPNAGHQSDPEAWVSGAEMHK